MVRLNEPPGSDTGRLLASLLDGKYGKPFVIDDGIVKRRWPAVHRRDAARVYRLALEPGGQEGPYHAVAEQGVPMREIAEAIGRRLELPVRGLPREEAAGHFGWFAHFASVDVSTSSVRTRALLGWEPQEIGLIADLEQPAYCGD